MLRKHAPLISAVAAAAKEPARRPALETRLDGMITGGWGQLVAALRLLLDGERDEDALTDALDGEDSLIVATALRALADPAVLAGLQVDAPSQDQRDAAMQELLASHAPLIHAIAAAALQPELRVQLDEAFTEMRQKGWGNLVDAAGRLLDGSRDADALCADLDAEDTAIIRDGLAGIQDPELLQMLASQPPPG
jgi:hypothetical protein